MMKQAATGCFFYLLRIPMKKARLMSGLISEKTQPEGQVFMSDYQIYLAPEENHLS